MNLQAYPRPKDDNGIGIHFRLDIRETDNHPNITQGVEWLQQIRAKWALVAGQDWNQISRTAAPIFAAGIMPICRLICKIDQGGLDWATGVRVLLDLGIPPYLQIFNEPGDSREWKGSPNVNQFGSNWADAAAVVFDLGGYPGMGAVLGKDEWQAAFNAVQANNRMDIWDKAWFSVHNYGSNHPPQYPYDDVNQSGSAVTPEDYANHQFSLPIDEVNSLRKSSAHPGATVLTDDTCVLRFLAYKSWMAESLGFCLPMIGGEGGWEWGNEEDHRYSKLTPEQHANFHTQMFMWFCNNKLSNGEDLPDELFSLAPWIMADWGADDWWYGPLGTKQGTIDSVASIPQFVRRFSWELGSSPPSKPQTDRQEGDVPGAPTTLPSDSSQKQVTYVVKQGETLWGIARKFGSTVAQIAKANDLRDPSKIRAGQKLIIPR